MESIESAEVTTGVPDNAMEDNFEEKDERESPDDNNTHPERIGQVLKRGRKGSTFNRCKKISIVRQAPAQGHLL